MSARWLGGMLTNFRTVKQSIARLKLEAGETDGTFEKLVKHEVLQLQREREKLEKLAGRHQGHEPPAGRAVRDRHRPREHRHLEAKKLGIPVVAVVDTNYDPALVDYAIPGNDDAIRAVQLYARAAADAVLEGKAAAPRHARMEDEFVELDAEGNPVAKDDGERKQASAWPRAGQAWRTRQRRVAAARAGQVGRRRRGNRLVMRPRLTCAAAFRIFPPSRRPPAKGIPPATSESAVAHSGSTDQSIAGRPVRHYQYFEATNG
jgi:small subunit ribosomal protein S2